MCEKWIARICDVQIFLFVGVEGKKVPGEIASFTNGTQESKTDDADDDTRWEQVRARNRTVYSSSVSNCLSLTVYTLRLKTHRGFIPDFGHLKVYFLILLTQNLEFESLPYSNLTHNLGI